jgi:integrase
MPKISSVPQLAACRDVKVARHGNSYRLSVSARLYEDGKQRRIGLGGVPVSEDGLLRAQAKQIELQREINNFEFDPTLCKYAHWAKPPRFGASERMNLGDIWRYWCEYKKPLLSAGFYMQKYESFAWNAITAIGQDSPIDGSTAITLRNWLLENRNKKDSVFLLKELENAVSKALNNKLIGGINPFFGISKDIANIKTNHISTDNISSQNSDNKKAFTPTERDKIINYFKEHYPDHYLFVYFRFFTGCRFGEAVELRWSDFSDDLKVVAFRRSYSFVSYTVKGTKTDKPRRFNLPDYLIEKLTENNSERIGTDLVFRNKSKSRITNTAHSKRWNRAINNLFDSGEISVKLSLNHTRHTLISIARDNGNSREAVTAQLGHSGEIQDKHYRDNSDRDKILIVN